MLKQIILVLCQNKEDDGSAGKEQVLQELKNCGITVMELCTGQPEILKNDNRSTNIALKDTLWITDSDSVAIQIRQAGGFALGYRPAECSLAPLNSVDYVFEGWEELNYDYFRKIYERMCGIPWDILETDRCLVRESTVEDVEAFYNIYAEPSVTLYMEDLFADKEEEIAYIQAYRESVYAFYGYGMWTVVHKESNQVIGRAGLSHREGAEDVELGFVIGVPWQRKGYAYEVCHAIVKYGLEYLGFDRIRALVSPDNQPSMALCKKLGFVPVGLAEEEGGVYQVYQYDI